MRQRQGYGFHRYRHTKFYAAHAGIRAGILVNTGLLVKSTKIPGEIPVSQNIGIDRHFVILVHRYEQYVGNKEYPNFDIQNTVIRYHKIT